MPRTTSAGLRFFFIGGALALAGAVAPASAQVVSVSLSDNLIVLDEQRRSMALELVNLSSDPVEFIVRPSPQADGTLGNGMKALRWAPERALAAAHRTVPMRVSSRLPADTPPGEYMFKAYVRSESHQAERPRSRDTPGSEAAGESLSVTIPIAPSLPVTVYMRHRIDTPMVDAEDFVSTPDDAKYLGYFPVRKRLPQYSFVGYVQVLDRASRAVLNQGRLHLPQPLGGQEPTVVSQVRVPRALADTPVSSGPYCLKIWDRYPASGAATSDSCA